MCCVNGEVKYQLKIKYQPKVNTVNWPPQKDSEVDILGMIPLSYNYIYSNIYYICEEYI